MIALSIVANTVSAFSSGGAAYLWWKASRLAVPAAPALVGIVPPADAMTSVLGGGRAVIVNTDPINEIAAALVRQGNLNAYAAGCAFFAFLFQAAGVVLTAFGQ